MLQVSFVSNEQLSAIQVAVTYDDGGGADPFATLVRADFAETGSGPWTYTATLADGGVGDYEATLLSAQDASGNEGASGETDSVTIAPTGPSRIYFASSHDAGSVWYIPRDGSAAPIELFDEGSVSIQGISVDPINDFIYFARFETSGVNCGVKRRVASDGSSPTLLYNQTWCAGIWADPDNDRIWFTEYGTAGALSRVTLAGASKADVYTGLSNPRHVTYDPNDGRLYWALEGSGRVQRGTPAGGATNTYNAGSATNFYWVSHNHAGGYLFAGGGNDGASGITRRYGEAFTASDGSETSFLGAVSPTGGVWDEAAGRFVYAEDRVFKSCLADGSDIQTIRDCSVEIGSGGFFCLALG